MKKEKRGTTTTSYIRSVIRVKTQRLGKTEEGRALGNKRGGGDTHHDVVRVEDGHVLEDLSGDADELWCDQAADGKHGNASVLAKKKRRLFERTHQQRSTAAVLSE